MSQPRTLAALFTQWFPLALSFELMMLEGPAVQGAMGRLPQPALNLAAWGLTMSLALIIESPVIMLLATAIALVRDSDAFTALRRFVVAIAGAVTAAMARLCFSPLYWLVACRLMGQPAPIASAALPALRIMLLWSAAIAWRRFCQGVLVRSGQARAVSWGTAIRLFAAVGTAAALAAWGRLPGVQVGACALMAAVTVEALASTLFAAPAVRALRKPSGGKSAQLLTQRAICKFHAPLAATTLMTLLVQPMTSAALARLPDARLTLAAWPVVYMLLLLIRGWGLALQEITVAQATQPHARLALRHFSWLVGGVSTVVTLIIVSSPLMMLYLRAVLHVPQTLVPYARTGATWCILLPLFTALGSWRRGTLVAAHTPACVYQGMAIALTTHALLLVAGVELRLTGMWVAAAAFTCSTAVEYIYLTRRAVALSQQRMDTRLGRRQAAID